MKAREMPMPASGAAAPDAVSQHKLHRPRVPPSLLSIALGLAGLGQAWRAARPVLGVPPAVPDAIFALAAAVWLVLVTGYAAQGGRQLLADLRDPVLGVFVPVAAITGMILGDALATAASAAFAVGRVLVVGFLAVTVAIGGWLTSQWIVGRLDQDAMHPGYLLPAVAGGLIGAAAAAGVRLPALAEASFGIGIGCFVLLGSTIWTRLFFRPGLPPALVPTLAIELGVPAVAGVAYFALTGGAMNLTARALGGFCALMALVQLCFVPLYARLRFSPGFWAFAFAYAAAATDALLWITLARPPGATGYAIAVVTLITAFIAAIAARTLIAAVRGQLLPGDC
jgi:tellurite resistance protein